MLNNNHFENTSLNELKRELKELDLIDLKNTPFDDVFERVKSVFNGIVLCRIALSFGEVSGDPMFGLFRARKIDGSFEIEDTESYWAKPASLQKEYGRCNSIGQSRFYASNYFLTTLFECRARSDSEWIIAEFDSNDDAFFESVFLGGVKSGFDRMLGHQGKLDSFFANLSKSERKKNNLLYEYISKKLGENVCESSAHLGHPCSFSS